MIVPRQISTKKRVTSRPIITIIAIIAAVTTGRLERDKRFHRNFLLLSPPSRDHDYNNNNENRRATGPTALIGSNVSRIRSVDQSEAALEQTRSERCGMEKRQRDRERDM